MPPRKKYKKYACDHCGKEFAPQGLSIHRRRLGLPKQQTKEITFNERIEDIVETTEDISEGASILERVFNVIEACNTSISNTKDSLALLEKGQREMEAIRKSLEGN